MHVPYSMDDRELDLVAPWSTHRNEYDYPDYEYEGDSLAQATHIIDPPDDPLRYTESDMRKVLMKSISNIRDVDFQLARARDLLICVIDNMPHMGPEYITALNTAIRQFLQES